MVLATIELVCGSLPIRPAIESSASVSGVSGGRRAQRRDEQEDDGGDDQTELRERDALAGSTRAEADDQAADGRGEEQPHIDGRARPEEQMSCAHGHSVGRFRYNGNKSLRRVPLRPMPRGTSPPTPMWTPSPERVERALITRFARERGLPEEYAELQRWSVEHIDEFWAAIWEDFGVSGGYEAVLGSRDMPGASGSPARG